MRGTVIPLAVVSTNRFVWHGVQRALNSAPHICLVGLATGGLATDRLLGRTNPAVILLDLDSPFELTQFIQTVRTYAPSAKILGLGGVGTENQMHDLRIWLDGLVLTVQPPGVMIRMIESLNEARRQQVVGRTRGPVISHDNEASEAPSAAGPARGIKEPASLTARERQIITLVGRGLANKDIATHLCISEITVRHHLTSIFGKLGVTGRQKLLIHAYRDGYLDREDTE